MFSRAVHFFNHGRHWQSPDSGALHAVLLLAANGGGVTRAEPIDRHAYDSLEKSPAGKYFRENPQPLPLGQIAFAYKGESLP